MTGNRVILPAQIDSSPGDAAAQAVYELVRWRQFDGQHWHLLLVAGVVMAVAVFVWMIVRRDTIGLRAPVGYLLFALRLAAFAGLLLFFLDLQKRTVHRSVHDSRVLLLLDVSQSMGLKDNDTTIATPTAAAAASRIEQVAATLTDGPLLAELRRVHDVVVYVFDRSARRLFLLPKRGRKQGEMNNAAVPNQLPGVVEEGLGDPIDWHELLLPEGAETHLGGAMQRLFRDHRATPVAGLIVVTDGGQNAGVDPDLAVRLACEAEIPIYTVGVGSNRRPAGVRVSDVVAPVKAYGGDAFVVTAYLQAQGLAGRTVTVELLVGHAADGRAGEALEASERVVLGDDDNVVAVKFTLVYEQPGRKTYRLRVSPPPEDRNTRDNEQTVDVEIVDRAIRVLLLAGAATREYRFLRNLLWRDKDAAVDVLLQTGAAGISQDADRILDALPSTKEGLYAYDALVAFDPDWTQFDSDQITLLEGWVADQASGLIVIAGPIHTAASMRDPGLTMIRDLYPVVFRRHISLAADSPLGSETAVPVMFTQEGSDAEFLWLGETATESAVAWSGFPGVFSCAAAKQAKLGATVYAHLSDPDASSGASQPVLLAEHFYGSGRVFYIGSGEMWRLRALDEAYFEQFYTKLLRHVSQGRLLRGSSRGLLLVERDRYVLGDTVVVRAQLTDAQHEPLQAQHVTAQVTYPGGTTRPTVLEADPARPGMFLGQLTATEEGGYRIDLPMPHSIDQQLTRRIQVKVPDRERQNPQRNDALLSEIAARTGGSYYVGLDAAQGRGDAPPLAAQLHDRTEVTMLSGAPDRRFQQRLMRWLLLGICSLLCLEWLTRRLCKLA